MTSWIGFGITTTDARTGKRIAANVQIVDSTGAISRVATMATPEDEGFMVLGCADGPAHLTITAAGYVTIDNPSYAMPGPVNPNFAMTPTAAPRPSRDVVLAVRASFCSHKDSRGVVVFDPAIAVAPANIKADWIDTKKRMGVTHIVLAPVLKYDAYKPGFDPSAPNANANFDWQDEPQKFLALIREMLDAGLIPVVYVTNGDPVDQDRLTDGRFASMCDALSSEAAYCVWLGGWENFGLEPQWESASVGRSFQLMRQHLGASAVLAEHINSSKPGRGTWASHPVQPNDPTRGDEMGAHYMAGGEEVSLFFYQTCYDAESPVFNLDAWKSAKYDGAENPWNRWAECLVRFVPTGTYIPAWDLTVPSSVPYWFAAGRPVGPMQMVLWEPGVPYPYLRGECSDDQVRAVSRFAESCGVLQGCYVPPKG